MGDDSLQNTTGLSKVNIQKGTEPVVIDPTQLAVLATETACHCTIGFAEESLV